jgi:hypothetical protein
MGMRGHAALTRDDGSVFVHLHPMGTISVASQLSFEERQRGDTAAAAIAAAVARAPSTPSHDVDADPGAVTFPFAFPKPGRYALWVEVKRDGRILTGVFAADVRER